MKMTKKWNRLFIYCMFFISSFSNLFIFAQDDISTTRHSYIITDVSIVDIEKGCIQPNRTVFIQNGYIKNITQKSRLQLPQKTHRIDGHNLYLMPGLVDAHVHFIDPETFGPLCVAYGVLFVRETGDSTETALDQREKLKKGELFGPDLITTGSMLDGNPPFVPQASISCSTSEQGRAVVRKQKALGVDQIKVYSGLKKDVFLAIVDEANKLGIKPVGHVPESIYIEEAIEAGLKGLEHLMGFGYIVAKLLNEPVEFKVGGMGTDFKHFLRLPEVDRHELQKVLKRMSKHNIVVCPTMMALQCAMLLNEIFDRNYPMLDHISPFIFDIWLSIWAPQRKNTQFMKQLSPHYKAFVYELYKAGITLTVGTDLIFPGVIPGYSVHEEMISWQNTGIPPIDILRSATITPIRFFGLEDSLGTVTEGKKASLVLLRDNPLQDIKNTQKIEGIFFRGQYFNHTALSKMKKEVIAKNMKDTDAG